MSQTTSDYRGSSLMEPDQLQQLFSVLVGNGYRVVGPTMREGAIVYDDVVSIEDLPSGWTDEQDGRRPLPPDDAQG